MSRTIVLKGGPLDGKTAQPDRPVHPLMRRGSAPQKSAYTHEGVLGRYNMDTGEWTPLEDQRPDGLLIIDTSEGAKELATATFFDVKKH